MIVRESNLPGVFIIDIERREDLRGFFARLWCSQEFREHGLAGEFVQSSVAYNHKEGTLRGMHWQAPPSREARLVRCTAGAAFAVAADLRPDSGSFREHMSVILDQENHTSLFVPPGRAFGYQTLTDRTEIIYHMTDYYDPDRARGFRWNDPQFGIRWPLSAKVVLERDDGYPDFASSEVSGFAGY